MYTNNIWIMSLKNKTIDINLNKIKRGRKKTNPQKTNS